MMPTHLQIETERGNNLAQQVNHMVRWVAMVDGAPDLETAKRYAAKALEPQNPSCEIITDIVKAMRE